MRTIVLAGGLGTRLAEETVVRPKPMVEIGGKFLPQSYFKDRPYRVSGELANTDLIMRHSFWIGLYPGLSRSMLDCAIEQIRTFLRK